MSKTHKEHIQHNRGFIKDQREFFDKLITNDWDTYLNEDWDKARLYEVDRILQLIPVPKRVLDIGCGCGYHDLLFASHDGIEKVVGIDNSEKSIETANREYCHKKIKRIVADIFNNNEVIDKLLNDQFDLIVSFQVIEHLMQYDLYLPTISKYVKSKGHIAIITPNKMRLQNRLLNLFNKPLELIDPLHYK